MSGYDDAPRKGGFRLDDYKTVPERMAEALEKYPEASLQSEIVNLPAAFADKFIAVKAQFFREPSDPSPGEGLAWEPVPGKTSFTKESELMNAETSAWGRAIVAAFAADAKKGIASREEVQARQTPKPRQNPTTSPTIAQDASNGEPELEAKQWSGRLKIQLVALYDGDRTKARETWVQILTARGYGPDDLIKPEDREMIEQDVAIALLPVEQAPFV